MNARVDFSSDRIRYSYDLKTIEQAFEAAMEEHAISVTVVAQPTSTVFDLRSRRRIISVIFRGPDWLAPIGLETYCALAATRVEGVVPGLAYDRTMLSDKAVLS